MTDELHEYLFHQGTDYQSYEFLGCHQATDENGNNGWIFRTWATNAVEVSVVGDFNGWDKHANPCKRLTKKGLWASFVPNARLWDNYKFLIMDQEGNEHWKADPFGTHHQTSGETASKVYELPEFHWKDSGYINYRDTTNVLDRAVNIYECHIGSWRKYPDGNTYSYRRFAEEALPYVKGMGYTHIELMGIAEHPFDGSWGYQVTGYFAPTSRYGTPEDFMYLVDTAHQLGIGVILDWVPGHFPRDSHGLRQFDGTAQYEYEDAKKGEHKEWGTLVFDYGKEEVQAFLVSNALYWMDKYHIDGLRVDAVASMLYLDYNRKDGEWMPNSYGGKENLEVIAFFQKLNTEVFARFPGVMMIAEESTAWPMVTKPVHDGGLGFNFKWNMGWMNDIMRYIQLDPYFRRYDHEKITFSFMYVFSENYILPISHDEVVYGKKSLFSKFFGSTEEKLASMRGFLAYMAAHPGKKLTFMGTDLAQIDEWNYKEQLDWSLLEEADHKYFHDYLRELNHFYLERRELWEVDTSWEGCKMLVADDKTSNVIAFLRRDRRGKELLCVTNFSASHLTSYEIGTGSGSYRQVFCSAMPENQPKKPAVLTTTKKKNHGSEYTLDIELPPFATIFFEYYPDKQASRSKSAAKQTEGKDAKTGGNTTAKQTENKTTAKKATIKAVGTTTKRNKN